MSGPFNINDKDDDGWDWTYSRNHEVAVKPIQRQFARQCAIRANRIRAFSQGEISKDLMERVKEVFSVGLVGDQAIKRPDEDYETDGTLIQDLNLVDAAIIDELAEPTFHGRVKTYFYFLVPAVLVLAAISFLLQPRLPAEYVPILISLRPYIFIVMGVLLGRAFSYIPLANLNIGSFSEYSDLIRNNRSPLLDLLFDALIGIVATLAFTTSFIVIEIGATGADGSGISTKNIAADIEVAIVFGIIVGIARSEFISRLLGSAKKAVEG